MEIREHHLLVTNMILTSWKVLIRTSMATIVIAVLLPHYK